MQLNLPIVDHLANSQTILIAGAGGGFDVFAGLPLYFTLLEQGKTVYLANYSFMEFKLAKVVSDPIEKIDNLLMGAHGPMKRDIIYYPEGYLADWFLKERGEDVTVWMFGRQGVEPLTMCYRHLIKELGIDAVIAVDGGVDSLMRGDEVGAGTLLEDSISLAAIGAQDIPVKILACIGFGTEVEESVCHHNALENMAALAAKGAFYGSCALTPQMPVFELYEAACRYVWEQPNHHKSHISTRVIPAVRGNFGNYHMYPENNRTRVLISLLMSLYWFFDLDAVVERNQIIPLINNTLTQEDAMRTVMLHRTQQPLMRPRRDLPY